MVRRFKEGLKAILNKVYFYCMLLGLWAVLFWLGVDVFHIWKTYSMPSPWGALNALWILMADGSLVIALGASLIRAVIGYFLSMVLGLLLGLLILNSREWGQNL